MQSKTFDNIQHVVVINHIKKGYKIISEPLDLEWIWEGLPEHVTCYFYPWYILQHVICIVILPAHKT